MRAYLAAAANPSNPPAGQQPQPQPQRYYYEGLALKPVVDASAEPLLRGWYQVEAAFDASVGVVVLDVSYEPCGNKSMPRYSRRLSLGWDSCNGQLEETAESCSTLPRGQHWAAWSGVLAAGEGSFMRMREGLDQILLRYVGRGQSCMHRAVHAPLLYTACKHTWSSDLGHGWVAFSSVYVEYPLKNKYIIMALKNKHDVIYCGLPSGTRAPLKSACSMQSSAVPYGDSINVMSFCRPMPFFSHFFVVGVKDEMAALGGILSSTIVDVAAPGRRPRMVTCFGLTREERCNALQQAKVVVLFLSPSLWEDEESMADLRQASSLGKQVVMVQVRHVRSGACVRGIGRPTLFAALPACLPASLPACLINPLPCLPTSSGP